MKITAGGKNWAFIPDKLPRKWQRSLDLWPIVATARETLARLDGIGRTLPDPELLPTPLQGREAIRSSRLA